MNSALVSFGCEVEGAGMEFEDSGKMGGEILPVMGARVEMEFVGNFAGRENFVEGGSAAVEAEVVFGTTVKIDFEGGEICGAGKGERIVATPENWIGRRAKGVKNAQ